MGDKVEQAARIIGKINDAANTISNLQSKVAILEGTLERANKYGSMADKANDELTARLTALESDNAALRERVKELETQLATKLEDWAKNAALVSLEYNAQNGIDIQVASPLARVLTEWALSDFNRFGGTNYVEQEIFVGRPDGPRFVLTIRKHDGKSPGQMVTELREAVRVLGSEMGRTSEYVRNLRNGYDDLHRTIVKVSCRHPSDALTQLLKSWPDWKKVNPIAAAAVKGGGQ